MGVQGNENSFFTCYLKVVLDRFFEIWNLSQINPFHTTNKFHFLLNCQSWLLQLLQLHRYRNWTNKFLTYVSCQLMELTIPAAAIQVTSVTTGYISILLTQYFLSISLSIFTLELSACGPTTSYKKINLVYFVILTDILLYFMILWVLLVTFCRSRK